MALNRPHNRCYTLIKFAGTVRRVTHPMLVVKKAVPDNVLAAEARAGTLKLLKGIELSLWDGDATCNAVEFDGFFRKFVDGVNQLATGASNAAGGAAYFGNIDTVLGTDLMMDLRNESLSEDHASQIVTTVSDDPNHGLVTDAYLPFNIHLDFSRQFYPKERGQLSNEGYAGTVIKGWNSPFGKVRMRPSKFVRMSTTANQNGFGITSKRPVAPTVTCVSGALAGGDPGPGMGGAVQGRTAAAAVDGAGTYYYQVVACNRYGESAPGSSAALVGVAVGDKVTLTITDNSQAGVTSYYKVYRTLPGAAAATAAGYIFKAQRTGAVSTVVDYNHFLPFTGRVYWVQRNLDAICFKQLLPLLKVNLAQIDLTVRFALILYGALEVFAPRKHGVMVNVGRLV